MTKLRYLLAVALAVVTLGAAAQRVSDLPAATALDGTELVPGVQGGVTKKVTAAQLDTYISASTKTLTNKTISGASNTLTSIAPSSVTGTAAILGANVFTGAQSVTNTTQSTSSTTGALIVSGGAGIAKNLYVSGGLETNGSFLVGSVNYGILGVPTINSPTAHGAAVGGTHYSGGDLSGGAWSLQGVNGSMVVTGALTTAPHASLHIIGVEGSVTVQSTGQTIPSARGGTFNVALTGTTNITEAAAIYGQQTVDTGAGAITKAYTAILETQTVGTSENGSLWLKGPMLTGSLIYLGCFTASCARITPNSNIFTVELADGSAKAGVNASYYAGFRSGGASGFPDVFGNTGGLVLGNDASGTNTQIILDATAIKTKGHILPTPDATYNIGAPGATRPNNVYIAGTLTAPYVTHAAGSAPSAPATGYTEYADSSGRRSWIRASDGFTRTWDSTLTGNRIYALPDADTTIAGLAVAQTFTARQTITQATANTAVLVASGHSLTGSNNTGGYSFLSTLNTTGASYDVFKIASTVTATGANTNLFAVYGGAAGATPSLVVDSANTVRMGTDSSLISKTSDLAGVQELATQATLYAMTTANTSLMVGDVVADAAAGAGIAFRRARGTAASPTDVVSADQMGYVDFRGYSGTKYWQVASIAAHVDAVVTTAQAPASRLVFCTTATNGVCTEKMRINNAGALTINGTIAQSATVASTTNTSTTGTNIVYADYVNTGGTFRVGRERSAGTGLLPGTVPYSGVVAVRSAHPLVFGTNTLIRMTIDSAGVVSIGTEAAASPAARQLNIGEPSIAGTSSNVGGANGTIASGLGTGTGTPSSLIFAVPVAVGSGTGAQTQTTVMTLNSSTGLTLGSAVVAPASSGTRYLCISTAGVVTSSASACSGT